MLKRPYITYLLQLYKDVLCTETFKQNPRKIPKSNFFSKVIHFK